MPRKPRFYLPDAPAHVIQRGNNRQAVFVCDDDYSAYLAWLREGAATHGCAIHAYVLMTNHVHLLVTPETRDGCQPDDSIRRSSLCDLRQFPIRTQPNAVGRSAQGKHYIQ